MQKYFPTMLDRPETSQIVASIFYSVIAFFSLPFILLLFMQGSFDNPTTLSIIEIIYHVINFIVMISIFWRYLADSFINVQADSKTFKSTLEISVALMFVLSVVIGVVFATKEPSIGNLVAGGTLPLAEMELFTLSGNLVVMNPIFGTICLVVLVPFTTSCVYYAATFAPICNNKPWLAYLVVTLYLAFPRLCNGLTYWPLEEELVLYLTQLPFHLIACWAYQKTDTIWAPIATHAIVNLLTCGLILVRYFL